LLSQIKSTSHSYLPQSLYYFQSQNFGLICIHGHFPEIFDIKYL
jgi:hypothetical protein